MNYKRNAKENLKKHYALYICICLISLCLGAEFTSALPFFRGESDAQLLSSSGVIDSLNTLFDSSIFEHTNGVLANIINGIMSGTLLEDILNALATIFQSKDLASLIMVILGMMISFGFTFLIVNIIPIITRRLVLEGRLYEHVPLDRVVFIVRAKQWMHVAWVMLCKVAWLWLMGFTIVGGIYYYYAYFLVEFMLAENPAIDRKRCFQISKEMMKGHKWECFKWQCSLIGWYILDFFTAGISNVLYTNAYRTCLMSEFYVLRREEYNTAILNDPYLFEYPNSKLMEREYRDVLESMRALNPMENVYSGFKKFLCDWFGVVFHLSKEEKAYENYCLDKMEFEVLYDEACLKSYPVRLSPVPEEKKESMLRSLKANRNYTPTSLIVLFFVMCFFGWVWEVGISLVNYGRFINRGVLHGPWIPIYGFGCLMILLFLKKLRMYPKREFFSAIVLCGFVEYFTGWFLELTHNGQRWWDYTGYFLNLHGRICAEGLLVFGIGGLIFVYVLAPMVDNWVRVHMNKPLRIICLCLVLLFGSDVVYSHFVPNEGEGITDNM